MTTTTTRAARLAAIRARLEEATAPGAGNVQRVNLHAHAVEDVRWLLLELLRAEGMLDKRGRT